MARVTGLKRTPRGRSGKVSAEVAAFDAEIDEIARRTEGALEASAKDKGKQKARAAARKEAEANSLERRKLRALMRREARRAHAIERLLQELKAPRTKSNKKVSARSPGRRPDYEYGSICEIARGLPQGKNESQRSFFERVKEAAKRKRVFTPDIDDYTAWKRIGVTAIYKQ